MIWNRWEEGSEDSENEVGAANNSDLYAYIFASDDEEKLKKDFQGF